jgi:hypothetical protein
VEYYPPWICSDCGVRYGKAKPGQLATFHEPSHDDKDDRCGWCGTAQRALTEPRDFGYPPLLRDRVQP